MAENEVLIETSARHVHVTQETLEALFGKGAQLTKKKDLSQPGQFASEQRELTGLRYSFLTMQSAGRGGCMPLRPALFFIPVPSGSVAVLPAASE